MTYVPAFPKPARLKDAAYVAWVRLRPCIVCGARSQAHHTVTKGARGSDLRTVALCWKHHAELHAKGPVLFEIDYKVDLKDEIIRSLESYIAAGRP